MQLTELRHQIDQLDTQLLELLNARMELVAEIGKLKRTSNTSIYRPEREKAIIDRLVTANSGRLNKAAIEAIFLEIFAVSRNIEMPEKVAYLGPEGSFTHQAAEKRFGGVSEYIALSNIKAVFEAVETGRVRFGVVPIENNQEGMVMETVNQLGRADVHIVAEVPMAIHFSFATHLENPTEVRKIYSKDIAFKQCRHFLQEYFGADTVELIPVESTSKAARLAHEQEGTAAICSHIAAKLYDVPVLFENIEDSTENFTRFLIISKEFVNQRSAQDKTTILARLPDTPGSLADFLQEFHKESINLTKIESYPAKLGKGFKYWFFIEFEGHYGDENVQRVLQKHEQNLRWLGSYVKLC
jgi:chorismate mutase / prephenate dehydratase